MVRIRLRRTGAKKKPSYRVVVANQRSPRNGRFIETIGTYNPCTEPETVNIQLDRASHWVSVGAQPSDAVARLLQNAKLIDEKGKLQSEDIWGDKESAVTEDSILIDDADVGIVAEDISEETVVEVVEDVAEEVIAEVA